MRRAIQHSMWLQGAPSTSSSSSSLPRFRCSQHEILQLLLAAGADLGQPNLAGETPMALLGNLPADITEVGVPPLLILVLYILPCLLLTLILHPPSPPILLLLTGDPGHMHPRREAGQDFVCYPNLPLPEPATATKRGGFRERGGKQRGDGHDRDKGRRGKGGAC